MNREVLRVGPEDIPWIIDTITARWGSTRIVSRGQIFDATKLPGFITWEGGSRQGLITYSINEEDCEIVTLDSLQEGKGIGSALIEALRQEASQVGCHRLQALTTNDNLPALRFYQRRGFRIVEVNLDAVEESRNLKSSIPETGYAGIPIRDEIILELKL